VTYGSTWSAEHFRMNLWIKLIRMFCTDQVDPYVLYGSTWSVSSYLIRGNELYMRIKLIHKYLTDQLDPREMQYTRTHPTLRTSYVAVGDHCNTEHCRYLHLHLHRNEQNKKSTAHRRHNGTRECVNASIVPFLNAGDTVHGDTVHRRDRWRERAKGAFWEFF